jgi:hypothetical protein
MNRIDQLFQKKMLGTPQSVPTDQDLADFEKLLEPKKKNRFGFFFLIFFGVLLSAAAWSSMHIFGPSVKARPALNTILLTTDNRNYVLLTTLDSTYLLIAEDGINTKASEPEMVQWNADSTTERAQKVQHNAAIEDNVNYDIVLKSGKLDGEEFPYAPSTSLLQSAENTSRLQSIKAGLFRNLQAVGIFPVQASVVEEVSVEKKNKNRSIAVGISPQWMQLKRHVNFGSNALDTTSGRFLIAAHAQVKKQWKRWEAAMGLSYLSSKSETSNEEVEYGYFYQRKDPLGSFATEEFDESLYAQLTSHYSVRQLAAWSIPLSVGYVWCDKSNFQFSSGLGGNVSLWNWSTLSYVLDERATETQEGNTFELYNSFFGKPILRKDEQVTLDAFLYTECKWKCSSKSALAVEPQIGWNRMLLNPRLPSVPTVRYGVRFSYVFQF